MNNLISRGGRGRSVSERCRIVRVIDRLNVGGPSKHVAWLSAGLHGSRFDTTLVAGSVPSNEGDMSEFVRGLGVEPAIVPEMSREISPKDLLVLFKLVRLFMKLEPEIIHTHKAKAGAVGRLAGLIYKWATPSSLWLQPRRCAIVHTYHGHVFHSYFGPLKTRAFLAIERALARMCTDRIVAISEQQRREILDDYKVGHADQFEVIPLGIDARDFEAPNSGLLRKELGIPEGRLVVGAVGRLCRVKDYSFLLRAFSQVLQGGINASLILVGDGELRADLESEARSLGISGNVTFTGFRNDVPQLYSDFDLVALSSRNEGTPLTLIEAMAAGRAVVATEVGGVADIMGGRRGEDGAARVWDHGLTVPVGDLQSLAGAMACLLQNAEERNEMGRRGKEFVSKRLGVEQLTARMETLYQNLLGLNPEARSTRTVQVAT